MTQVIDYSAGFPGAGNILAAGFGGAVRYIGFPDRRKCATAAELADFRRRGIGMALVYQDGTGDFLGGFSAGVNNANRARRHANDIGFPGDRPIYMAIDRDVVAEADFTSVLSYLGGAASVLGGVKNVGVYGEFDVVRRAIDGGHVRYGWQTAAWSGGRHYAGAHLYQRIGTARVGGIACDINDVLSPDWGQHNYAAMEVEEMTSEEIKAIAEAVWGRTIQLVQLDEHGDLRRDEHGNPATVNVPAFTVLAYSDARAQGSDVTTRKTAGEILAAIQPGGMPSDEQVAQLADRLNVQLGGAYQVTITKS